MRRGSRFPAFFDWEKDPNARDRQQRSIADELQALWAGVDVIPSLIVMPAPPRNQVQYDAHFGEHVFVSVPPGGFMVALPSIASRDEGAFVDISRDRADIPVMVLAGERVQELGGPKRAQTINGARAYLLGSDLSPRRFRVVNGVWRT